MVLVFLIIGLAIGTFVGAVLLRAAVSLFNKLSGGRMVAEPDFGKACVIALVTSVANGLGSLAVTTFVGEASPAAGNRHPEFVAQAISMPVTFLIMVGMLCLLLPTTFVRAIMVTLCYFVVVIAIVIPLGALAYFMMNPIRC